MEALKLNIISRSLCVISIGLGKISIAFLIERIAPPGNWRKWLLRGISLSIAVTGILTVALLYAQCHPVRALWDKKMIAMGTAECWDPLPLNRFNLVAASEFVALLFVAPLSPGPFRKDGVVLTALRYIGYWAFLDFALAFIPVDIVWRLRISKKKRLSLCLLLSMGVL